MHSCQWASDLLWTSNVNSGLHIDVHWTSKGLQLVFSTFTAGFTMFALFFSIFFYHFEHIILENKFCYQVFVSFQWFFFHYFVNACVSGMALDYIICIMYYTVLNKKVVVL